MERKEIVIEHSPKCWRLAAYVLLGLLLIAYLNVLVQYYLAGGPLPVNSLLLFLGTIVFVVCSHELAHALGYCLSGVPASKIKICLTKVSVPGVPLKKHQKITSAVSPFLVSILVLGGLYPFLRIIPAATMVAFGIWCAFLISWNDWYWLYHVIIAPGDAFFYDEGHRLRIVIDE